MVSKRRYHQTPAGWRRYFWAPKDTEILAEEGQATAADLCKFVLRFIFEKLAEHEGWEILTTTHDSYLLHVPLADVERAKDWLRERMEVPVPWLDNRTWRCDVKSGPNWRAVS